MCPCEFHSCCNAYASALADSGILGVSSPKSLLALISTGVEGGFPLGLGPGLGLEEGSGDMILKLGRPVALFDNAGREGVETDDGVGGVVASFDGMGGAMGSGGVEAVGSLLFASVSVLSSGTGV